MEVLRTLPTPKKSLRSSVTISHFTTAHAPACVLRRGPYGRCMAETKILQSETATAEAHTAAHFQHIFGMISDKSLQPKRANACRQSYTLHECKHATRCSDSFICPQPIRLPPTNSKRETTKPEFQPASIRHCVEAVPDITKSLKHPQSISQPIRAAALFITHNTPSRAHAVELTPPYRVTALAAASNIKQEEEARKRSHFFRVGIVWVVGIAITQARARPGFHSEKMQNTNI